MRAVSIGLFLLRHAVMTPAITAVLCLGWVAVYLTLLALAILGNQPLGGPLTLPAGVVAVIVLCAIVGWGIFTPACALGAALRSVFRPPLPAILLAVWLAGALLGYGWAWVYVTRILHESAPPVAWTMARSALYLSVPLGLYWWATESAAMLPEMVVKALKRFRHSRG